MKTTLYNLGFVFWTRLVLTAMVACIAYVAVTTAYNLEGYIMCTVPTIVFVAIFLVIGIKPATKRKVSDYPETIDFEETKAIDFTGKGENIKKTEVYVSKDRSFVTFLTKN